MTLWLIGEAPTRHTTEPFTGRAGDALRAMTGLDLSEFKLANVLDEWPGPGRGKGARFPLDEARKGVIRLLAQFKPGDRIIIVGGRSAYRAWRMAKDRPPYKWWRSKAGWYIAFIPHPSGVNRLWNDPDNVIQLRRFMQDAVRFSEKAGASVHEGGHQEA